MRQFRADYVVVGGGSAGCALASRLAAEPGLEILLLEAGGPAHAWDFRLHMPAAMGVAGRSKRLNWGYHTAPQEHLQGRSIRWPRGHVLGGSSSINAMVFVRGNAGDYDGWAADPALHDWSYANVLPYFKRLETYSRGGNAYRGDAGPVHVRQATGSSPLHEEFIAAAIAAGHPFNDDMNGASQEGVGWLDMNVHDGRRMSAARAYLRDAAARPNLTVLTGSRAVRLVVEGRCCRGVFFQRGNETCEARAEREIILTAGAIGTPQLLMVSGIGPADHLREVGIIPRHHLEGVGANLHDHPQVFVQYACTKPITLQAATRPLRQAVIGARWLVTRRGWGMTNHHESGGFIRADETQAWPNIQFSFLPRAMHALAADGVEIHGFQVNTAVMRPRARGRLTLRSNDPLAHPSLDPRYFSHPLDLAELIAGVREVREIIRRAPLDPYRGREVGPGETAQSDADIAAYIRSHAGTAYHPTGTCKMGSTADAVVDGDLLVHGLDGLRVADSSIMPVITTGNLNAPSLMIGEKAADIILDRSSVQLHVLETVSDAVPKADRAVGSFVDASAGG